MSKTVWINTGELSGDMHGAMLVRAMRRRDPGLNFVGMGGPHLREAGLDALFRIEDLSVMGLTEVLGHLPKIFRLLREIKRELERRRPDAIIVIDSPDFNFRVIKAARQLNIPVYYYISPKVWAWRQGRARFIKENVRRLISILPFEEEFFRGFGLAVDYVGNPLVDMIDLPGLDAITPEPGLVGILPGSRKKEISALLPEFSKAAAILARKAPGLSFACIRAPNISEDFLRANWAADVPLVMEPPEGRWRFMRRCCLLMAASGTVTLESALVGTPTLVAYKVSPLSFLLGKLLVKVPWMSLPNLIMNREVFPEFLQGACNAASLAAQAWRWLGPGGKEQLAGVRRELGELRRVLGKPGAADRAAEIILRDMAEEG